MGVVLGQDLDGVPLVHALRDAADADARPADHRLSALDLRIDLDPLIAQPRIALGCVDGIADLRGPAHDERVPVAVQELSRAEHRQPNHAAR